MESAQASAFEAMSPLSMSISEVNNFLSSYWKFIYPSNFEYGW